MRKDNSTLLKKLKQYSAITAPLLATAGLANAQINYTDLDPDVILLAGEALEIDLNNDGIADFNFLINSATFTGGTTAKFVNGVMQPYTTANLNGFVGTIGTLPNGYPIGYPSALDGNVAVDANQSFFLLPDLLGTGGYFFLPGLLSVYNGTSSFGNWQGGATDKFIGLQFSPDAAALHYGWVRCDVASDGTSITLKDYAWNETADEEILTGDSGGIGFADVSESNDFSIFSFEGVVNVIVNDAQFEGTVVSVINVLGQTVLTQSLNAQINRINLNDFGKGIYMVTIQRGDEHFAKKVSFR